MWSVLFLLAAVLVATDATVVSWLYSGSGLQNKTFTQNVLFTSAAKSAVHCSLLCNKHESCETFTFEQDLCRGHAVEVSPDTPYVFAAGARSFSKSNNSLAQSEPTGSQSGVVTIYPDNVTALQVYRDEDTDGGGWTVFQRRIDGSVDFYRNWTEFQHGFGNLMRDFWLGLDALHMLTSRQRYELRVDLMMWDGTKGNATYSNFSISDSSDNYRLNLGSFTGGNAGDSLTYHSGQQFSTWDRDHDTSVGNCAEGHLGAWWHVDCAHSNLNGQYLNSTADRQYQGVSWFRFAGWNALQFSEMKIRVV